MKSNQDMPKMNKCPRCRKVVDKPEYHIYNDSVEQMCPHCWSFMDAPVDDSVEWFWAWLFMILLVCAIIGLCIGKAIC